MRAENLSVAAAFDLSYADLTPGQQRLFRRLGLVPGPSIDAYAAAALDGTSLGQARRHLDELYDQHLITEPAPGRYQLHDLLREHARALAAADDPADSRRRGRAAAGLLPAHRPGRRPALRPLGQRATAARRPAARRRRPRTCPPSGRRPPGWKPSARTCTPPRTTPPPAARSRHAIADPRRDWRLPGRPRSLGSVRRPAPDRPGRSAPGWRPARRGRRARRRWASCSGRPGTTRPPPPAWPGHWRCTATSVTSPARPTPSTSWASCSVLTGDYPAAAASHQQALALARGAR